jgi:hypothetical protein
VPPRAAARGGRRAAPRRDAGSTEVADPTAAEQSRRVSGGIGRGDGAPRREERANREATPPASGGHVPIPATGAQTVKGVRVRIVLGAAIVPARGLRTTDGRW